MWGVGCEGTQNNRQNFGRAGARLENVWKAGDRKRRFRRHLRTAEVSPSEVHGVLSFWHRGFKRRGSAVGGFRQRLESVYPRRRRPFKSSCRRLGVCVYKQRKVARGGAVLLSRQKFFSVRRRARKDKFNVQGICVAAGRNQRNAPSGGRFCDLYG